MGGAILSGLLGPEVKVDGGIRVTNRTAAKANAISGAGVTSLSTEREPDANLIAVRGAKIVLIGVKPAMVVDVLAELRDAIEPDAIVVSVAAGVTTATMESIVPHSVVRAMPNTPSTVGRGVTGLSGGSRATAGDVALVVRLFETVGTVLEVPEDKMNELSTISGSGPAYVFYFIEELTRTAIGMGFTAEQAELMVNNTFLGAAELLTASGEQPTELRRRVTSPNGTTERAIAELQKADLKSLFDRATAAALARAEEMAKGA
jgi:pyrroline-5-carboxylate reductase